MSNQPPPPYGFNGGAQRIIIIPGPSNANGRRRGCCYSCGQICLAPLKVIGFLFGFGRKMEMINRLVISFFTFAAISIAAGLLLGFVTYGPNDFQASPTDMRQLDEKFSTKLCSRFEVEKANAPVDVYFFDQMPPIRRGFYKNYTVTIDPEFVDSKHWAMSKVYMLKGSHISVYLKGACLGSNVQVFLIKGAYNLGEWTGDHDCCYLKKDSPSFMGSSFSYKVTETDVYYITMAAEYSFMQGCSVSPILVMRKTTYDLRGATKVCANFTDPSDGNCGQDLHYNSNQVALFYASGKKDTDLLVKSYTIHTMCEPRLALYLPCFLAAPLICYLFWALLLWYRFRECNGGRQSGLSINANDRADLVSNQVL